MKKLLFIVGADDGWGIVGERLRREIVSDAPDEIDFVAVHQSALLMRFSWQMHYGSHVAAHLPIFDPYTVNRFHARKVRRRVGEYRAILAATQEQACLFANNASGIPVYIFLDATRHMHKTQFGSPYISDRQIDRERRLYEAMRHIFTLSNWAANDIVSYYGVSRERVTVVAPPGPRSLEAFSKNFEIASAAPRINLLFVGGDFERKGGPDLIRWQQEEMHQYANLLIVSPLSNEVPSVPNTRWLGSLPNDAIVDQVLPSVDVLIHPTKRDCSSLVVVEAAMAAVPSVVSNVGGIADLVEHGRTGYLLDPRDEQGFIAAVRRLSDDRSLLRSMGESARTKALAAFRPETLYGIIVHKIRSDLGHALI